MYCHPSGTKSRRQSLFAQDCWRALPAYLDSAWLLDSCERGRVSRALAISFERRAEQRARRLNPVRNPKKWSPTLPFAERYKRK